MSDGFVPPQAVRSAAKRGLALRKEFGRGGTAVGIARARDLSNGTAVSFSTIKRMNSFFARHEVDKKGKDWDNSERPSNGKIAWLLWGGDAGWAWAKRIIREQESKEKSVTLDKSAGNAVTSAYASIVKYDKNDDGTLLVFGKATDDSLDIDQQICDAAWLDRAMPEWFKSGGNIREQHSQIAAGVAKEYESKGDGHYITALVVDPVSVKKVENQVLKGFSIGIKSPRVIRDQKAANGRIVDGQIVEVSLVDRPANPNAKLMLAKSVDGELAQVEELVENQEAAAQIAEANKFLAKFDAKAFEQARNAIANLIQVEAGEITEGHDERASLWHLFEAISHLQAWFEGEEAEGEVSPETEDMIERAADKDEPKEESDRTEDVEETEDEQQDEQDETDEEDGNVSKSEDEEKCADCGESMKMCKCNKEADMEKSIEGEDAPAEAGEPVEDSEGTTSEIVEEIVEKAVASALSNIRAEVTSLLTAKEAAEEKAAGLELQVAELLTKAVGGGPKRTGRTMEKSLDDNLVKAATYRAKAAAATDPILAKGYRTLAEEYEAKTQPVAE